MQVVLDVGNALNAGTAKGNAVGFKLSTLLKLAELKGNDKKTTLLHFVAEVVLQSAPAIIAVRDAQKVVHLPSSPTISRHLPMCMQVCDAQKVVRDACRVSLDELQAKKLEVERGLAQVDAEITWHDEQRLRGGGGSSVAEEDQFPEVFTEFYNWAAEKKDEFDEKLESVTSGFAEARDLLGESEVKEPSDLFDTLEKFIRRFETVYREVDEAKRAADEQRESSAKAPGSKKQLRSRMGPPGLGGPKKIAIKPRAGADGASAPAPPLDAEAIPTRRLSSAPQKRNSTTTFDAIQSIVGGAKRP
jgi:hypothetical protein